jgi:hyperosmotically inducible protein
MVERQRHRLIRGRRGFMTGILRSVTVMLAIVLLTAACQSATGRSMGTNVDDATITASVKSRLVGDKPANLTRVDVDTNNGTVYLNGTVESAEQKTRAEQLARQARGVRTVVNNLQVLKK